MLRKVVCLLSMVSTAGVCAAAVSEPARTPPPRPPAERCAHDLASVDRAFAEAMRDLQKTGASDARCTSWRRQIDVMRKASDVFARCTVDEARAANMSQMEGSIADFRAMIDEAKCP